MPNPSVEKNDQDFVLKHRIAGAAFLLFFGALVLPWLLGPPSEAKKDPVSEVVSVDAEQKTISEDLENEILAELQESIEDGEQVYISKITPEGKISKLVNTKDEKSQESERTVSKIQPIDTPKSTISVETEQETISSERKDTSVEKVIAQSSSKEQESEQKQSDNKPISEQERARIAAAELAAALEAESKDLTPAVTAGWVVQVGMFVDKNKAANVFKDLGKKGFKPSTSVVDTNLGLGTGTRVWLGPYKERQEAVDMKAQLAKKTGTSGFIRSYP